MKILIVGDWLYPMYEAAFAQALEYQGAEVSKFETSVYFKAISGRIIAKFPRFGAWLTSLNRDLLSIATDLRPDWVLLWRCCHVMPNTLNKFRSMGIKIVTYNHDDPFGLTSKSKVPYHHHFLWHWYLKSLLLSDRNFFAREVNCQEALRLGARHVGLMRQYFVPWLHMPIQLTEEEIHRYGCDIVFAGHYEPDGREEFIQTLVSSGLSVKLYRGVYWTSKVLGDAFEYLKPIRTVEGIEYTKALNGAKLCLALMSTLNRDTFTYRCAEIPACGRVMLAQRNADLQSMFKEDEEACFFSSNDELIEKVHWLLANPVIRQCIAAAGLRRVWSDGHDVNSRVKYFLQALD